MPKAKEKPVAKMEKPENVLRSKTKNRQTAFRKLRFEAIVDAFLSRLAERKGNFVLNSVWKILVWQRLLCSKSGRQRGAPPVPVAFSNEFLFVTGWSSFFLLQAGFFSFLSYLKKKYVLLLDRWKISDYL